MKISAKFFVSVFFLAFVSACMMSAGDSPKLLPVNSSLLIQSADLPGLFRTVTSSTNPCSSSSVTAKSSDNKITVVHTVWICNDLGKANSIYSANLGKLALNPKIIPVTPDQQLNADQVDGWCENLDFQIGDDDTSCVVIIRYGRLVSKISSLRNSTINSHLDGTDLMQFLLTRDKDYKNAGK